MDMVKHLQLMLFQNKYLMNRLQCFTALALTKALHCFDFKTDLVGI